MLKNSSRTCLSGATISGIPVVCDRRKGHGGLHRDADADLTWRRADSSSEEGCADA
jgi:hypothetical protein